eukprot:scaffold2654_cov245-Chaetoceros_neogracile.AAC.3
MYQKLLEHKETKGYRLYVLKTLLPGRWLRRQSLKKGGAVGVRDAPSGEPPRKKRKCGGFGQ